MGWPGVGVLGAAFGIPGRGATGAAGIMGRGAVNFATRSARGGTTGRAAGCPASGRETPGAVPLAAAGGAVLAPSALEGDAAPGVCAVGRGPSGRGRGATGGRWGIPRASMDAGVPGPAGNGWRGPERIWPGLGVLTTELGSGLADGVAGRPGAITATGGTCGAGGGDGGCCCGGGASGMGRRASLGSSLGGSLCAAGCATGSLSGMATGGWMGRPANGGRIGAATGMGRTSSTGLSTAGGGAGEPGVPAAAGA